jgi:CheY-like chemotaxis protein
MSHELRTPLNSILGFADILGEENLEISERIDLAKRVQRNGLVLNKLIGEILDLSKIEAGKLELESMEVNLVELIKEVLQILSPSAEKKGIELRSEILGSIPTTVITDPTRLRQMLTNLIGNAIKFTTRGFVKVELQVDSLAKNISICIEDTGEGISEENQKKLFEAFVQVDSSHNRRFGGTGLGLSISRKIARAMGGDLVLLQSELNKGSSFLLTFPMQTKLNYMTKHNGGLEQNILPQSGQLTGVRILVADDTTDNLLLAERILTKQGAVVQKASSGQEALRHVSEEDFDLVLMDIQMPEMDGYEATRQLRQRGFKKPILALTAHAMSSEKERSLTMGFDDYLVKPVSKKELVAAIIRQLDQ